MNGREKNGQLDRFGVSGYVYHNVFLIFDRKTESLWWPIDEDGWTAISGPRKGEKIKFDEKPAPVPLGKWCSRRARWPSRSADSAITKTPTSDMQL